MQSPPLPRYLVPPRSKYSPQHHILKHPQLPFLPQCQRPSFTPIQNNRQNYGRIISKQITRERREGVDLIHLTQDGEQLCVVVNTAMNNVFQKMRRISSLTEKLVSSQEELCSMAFATSSRVSIKPNKFLLHNFTTVSDVADCPDDGLIATLSEPCHCHKSWLYQALMVTNQ
jgi:hypothetical protein